MSQTSFIFINGKGSCGKDTQADILLKRLGESAVKLSTGDIYRDAMSGTGKYGKFNNIFAPYVEHVEKQGGYFPDEVMINVVGQIVSENIESGINTFLFTGFPRTVGQMELMDEYLKEINGKSLYIHYELSDETSLERARMRREKSLEKGLSVRADDQEEVVQKRLNTFQNLTLPMLNKLRLEGRLITINAEGTIQDIERETSSKIEKEK